MIQSLEFLFSKLKKRDYYIIEDAQTSYWKSYGGISEDFNDRNTMYYFFKSLIDALNHEVFDIPNYKKSYFDKHILAMHFYHNMILLKKGNND
jgi:demethylmacrocin O-methyltransferase